MTLFVIASVLAGALGLMLTSPATMGVSLVGVAILSAIFARLWQAADQHQEIKLRLAPPPATTPE